MQVLVDTGVLLRAVHRADSRYSEVRGALRFLIQQRAMPVCGLQHLAEFWNVCTRPPGERGGFALSVEETTRRLHRLERGIKVITETTTAPQIWKALVQKHHVKGVQVHDARTVAIMLAHSISRLLTLNKADFLRFAVDGIVPFTPTEAIAGAVF